MLLVNGIFTVAPEQIEALAALVITGAALFITVNVNAAPLIDGHPAPVITLTEPLYVPAATFAATGTDIGPEVKKVHPWFARPADSAAASQVILYSVGEPVALYVNVEVWLLALKHFVAAAAAGVIVGMAEISCIKVLPKLEQPLLLVTVTMPL